MLPASNRGVGMNIGFPDVCLTPVGPAVVPIPYPNFAMHAMAAPFAATVLVTAMNGLNMASMIPMTMGDQPGVAHPTIMGTGRFTMGNPIVSIEGLPGINLLCPTTGNNMNDGLGAVLVPDAVNVFYTYARCGSAPGTPSAVEAQRAPLDGAEVLGAVHGGVAVVSITAFSSSVPARFFDLVQRLDASIAGGARALVVDLRGNPGGELHACVELASDFLPAGSPIVTTVDGEGDEVVHRARGGALYCMPVAIVVDRGTASAAELFAGCLQAHRRARVFGAATYGKASAQAYGEGGATYTTVARCVLPGGADIEGVGVLPDVEVSDDAAIEATLAALTSSSPA